MIEIALLLFSSVLVGSWTFKTHQRSQIYRFSCHCNHVHVYDGLLDFSSCKEIDCITRIGGLSHKYFNRGLVPVPDLPIEILIDSILNEINDTSSIVEYWWRDEWLSLEAHRDVDERLSQEMKILRYPENAHVLYLDVGDEVEGPTILYHEKIADRCTNTSKLLLQDNFEKISMIPAVIGRLLRFQGNMMHSVPRPALAYLDPKEGGTNTEIWTRVKPKDDKDPECTVFRRSVLLFNTWVDTPPLGVNTAATPSSSGTSRSGTQGEITRQQLRCTPYSCWVKSEIRSSTSDTSDKLLLSAEDRSEVMDKGNEAFVRLKIGLLGDLLRRGTSSRYLELYAPKNIKYCLTSRNIPYSVRIRQ